MREMKNSGVEWIGEIPAEWKIVKVKQAFFRKNEKAQQENPVVLSLARLGVKVRDITANEGQIAESYYNYNPVSIGDLLLNPMDLYSGANCSISKVEGVISPAYANLRSKEGYFSNFYDYYFKVQYWMMVLFAHGKGVSFDNRWTLTNETLMNFPVVAPSLTEQHRIADFLDKKCAKIDVVIEKQKQVIEKLKEYKLSVITEAVTKGLDRTVPMKDSGVECVGSIPNHWKVIKFKHICESIGDGLHGTPEYDLDGEYYFLNGNNIGNEKLVFKDNTDRLNEEEYKKYKPVNINENTILITLNGATYGKTSFYNNEKVLLGKSAGYITLKDSENKYFVRIYLQSHIAKLFMELSLCGSTIANLSLKTLNEFIMPYPPCDEQEEIVEYISSKCFELDCAIDKKQAIIDKLTEYKKSLIYEVVTGKREV